MFRRRPYIRFPPIAVIWAECHIDAMIVSTPLLALALSTTSASGLIDNIERITPETAARRAEQCGLGRVTVRYEEELQAEILTISDAAAASEDQLNCLDKATAWHDVALPPIVQLRFNAIREARASAFMVDEARKWLSARGLMKRVPKYVKGTSDDASFTRDVEVLCGARARGAFQSEYGFHALNPNWMKSITRPPKPEEEEAFACVLNVTTAAGFQVGFIGNEAYRTAK